jgi:hypothetical protein
MAIQGFFTGDVKIRDLNGVLKAVDGIVEVATDAGTVTSVGLTVGSTGTDVNVANSPITSSGNITLNLPTASATNRGLLSSADWSTFNSKQNALGYTPANAATTLTINGTTYDLSANRSWSVGTHTGSLTSGYIPKATGATTLTDGLLYDTGSAVLLGTQTAGSGKFMVYSTTADNHYQAVGTAPSFRFADTIVSPSYTGIIGLATATNHFIIGAAAGDMVLANNTTSSIGNFLFGTGATERMRITPTGNVSINNTNNTYRLDVNGTGRFTGQLRLESTITNGTYTYTLPGATGTLALTSDIPIVTGYVPYTGATQAVNLGAFDLLVQTLTIGKGNSSLANNTALGYRALFHITTGNYNTAVGYEAAHNTTTGQYNTALGQSALFTNTTGSQNTAIGLNALLYNTSGGSNVVVGLDAMQHNTTGSSNTALGYNAGTHITGGSTPNTTASSSVYIGRDTKAKVDGGANEIVIGYNAVGNGSNTSTFGNTSTTANYFTGSINGGSFVKSGGTSSQFLKADGSVDSSTYYLASNPSAFIALTALSATAPLSYSNTTGVFSISQATTSTNGYLSSTDWNTFYNKQAAGNYITALTGEATASGPGSASVTLSTSAVTGKLLTGLNLTGGGTIAATDSILQAFGKVQNQISGMVGGVTFQGTWDASTNTPTLTSSVGTKGYYYIVSVAGSTNLNGITDWKIGDWAIFNGTTWDKVDNTDAVSSVNGFTGAVSLTTSNISEGTNLYYLDSRARLALSFTAGSGAYDNTTGVITIPTNTSQLTNGANFITLSSLSASSPLAYNSGTGAFSIQVATGSQNGYLSSTDWTTFNSKQAALNGTGFVKISGTTISYDNSTYLTTSAAASTYLPLVLSSSVYTVDINGQQFSIFGSAGGYTSGRIVVDPLFGAVGYQISGVFNGLKISTNGNAEFTNSGITRFFNQVRFDSTLSNGTYTYTLPSATGTLALTSDIPVVTGYVPYTGATGAVDLGTNDLSSRYLNANGGAALGGVLNIKQDATYLAKGNGYSSIASTNVLFDFFGYTGASTYKNFAFRFDSLTNNTQRIYTLPDASGTLALTSDISGMITGSGTTNYLPKFTGTSTIGNSIVSESGAALSVAGSIGISGNYPIILNSVSGVSSQQLQYQNNGTNKWQLYLDTSNNSFNFYSSANTANRLTLTEAGNLGLGVTPSAWSTGNTLDINTKGSLHTSGAIGLLLGRNVYYDGSYKYKATGIATALIMDDGGYNWQIAGSGTAGNAISFTQAMTLNASGNLSIGNTNDTYKLDVTGTGRFIANSTTVLINSASRGIDITGKNNYYGLSVTGGSGTGTSYGAVISAGTNSSDVSFSVFNKAETVNYFQVRGDGAATFSSSVTIQSGNALFFNNSVNSASGSIVCQGGGSLSLRAYGQEMIGIIESDRLLFSTANTERMRINAAGNVGIGTSSPITKLTIGSYSGARLPYINGTGTTFGAEGITVTSSNTSNTSVGGGIDLTNNVRSVGAYSPVISFSSMTSGGAYNNSYAGIWGIYQEDDGNWAAGHIAFGTSNPYGIQEKMRLTKDGNLGIGTTSPAAALHVKNSAATNIYLESTGSSVYQQLVNSGGSAYIGSSSNDLLFLTNSAGNERMRITSGGNVGIGTSSPTDYSGYTTLHVNGKSGTGSGVIRVTNFNGTAGFNMYADNAATFNTTSAIPILFLTQDTERMRITSGGNVLIGDTSGSAKFVINQSASAVDCMQIFATNGGTGYYYNAGASTTAYAAFFVNSNGVVGSIYLSGTSTAYNTSSDYRLKTDLKDYSGLDLVSKIKTYDYEWKSDKTRSYGVIAHELQSVINYAVTGVKDGKEMQGVDYSKIVPVLIKAIQELNDKIK